MYINKSSLATMITIAELFPLYSTALKWQSLKTHISSLESVRLLKEYTIHTVLPDCEVYTVDGLRHREDGPAYIDSGSNWSYQLWYKFGNQHRENGPASLDIRKGVIIMESWYVDGKHHREDGPAYTQYHTNGVIEQQEWYVDYKLHREDGPAVIRYRENGVIEYEEWLIHGKCHRDNGPATTEYDANGVPNQYEWWIHGEYKGCEPADDDLVVQD